MNLSSTDLRTLQFGPLWVLCALAGTSRFDRVELEVFWDTLVEVALRAPQPARDVLTSLTIDRSGLVLDFELTDLPVVSGFSRVVAVLDRIEAETADHLKIALLRIGLAVGRARGPYGRQLTFEDTQRLLLIAQLLEIESTPSLSGDALV